MATNELERIDRYRITRKLAEGGMGAVHEAIDESTGRPVAIKTMLEHVRSDEAVARFEREARTLIDLSGHPNIVTIYDVLTEPPGLVMELLEGTDLAEAIRQQPGNLPWDFIRYVGNAALDALSFAHSRGVVHRDIKPSNIFLSRVGNLDVPKVMDFGIAGLAAESSQLTRVGARLGTLAYMSPEQHLGEGVDHRSDLYALGLVIYEMCTGTLPFDLDNDSDFAIARWHVERDVQLIESLGPEVPKDIRGVIEGATRKDPDQRFASADAMAQVLQVVRGQRLDNLVITHARSSMVAGTVLDRPDASGSNQTIVDQPAPNRRAVPRTVLDPAGAGQGHEPTPPQQWATGESDASTGNRNLAIGAIVAALVAAAMLATFMLRPGSDDDETREAGQAEEDRAAEADGDREDREATRLRSVTATASSEGSSERAAQAIDGRTNTWWMESVDGDGVGEHLTLRFPRSELVSLRIVPGYMKQANDRHGDRWSLNNRLRRVRVTRFDGDELVDIRSFDLDDRRQWHELEWDEPAEATAVRLEIQRVYYGFNAAGRHISDSGISEVEILGRSL